MFNFNVWKSSRKGYLYYFAVLIIMTAQCATSCEYN